MMTEKMALIFDLLVVAMTIWLIAGKPRKKAENE